MLEPSRANKYLVTDPWEQIRYFAADWARDLFERQLGQIPQRGAKFAVVSHIVHANEPLLLSLQKASLLGAVFPKRNSTVSTVLERLEGARCPIMKRERSLFLDALKEQLRSGPMILIDIGGTFAGSLEELNIFPNLLGIIEDTENGHRKYEKALASVPRNKIPIISIARDPIKSFEDVMVGSAIALVTRFHLALSELPQGKTKFGIIGFGEVGRGAAQALEDVGSPALIYDSNDEISLRARNAGFHVVSKEELLRDATVIIGATGNRSIGKDDWKKIQSGSVVASCTSNDDEFSLPQGLKPAGVSGLEVTENGIYLINHGNAVNFLLSKRQSREIVPFIYFTHAALLACPRYLDMARFRGTDNIFELPKGATDSILDFYKRNPPGFKGFNTGIIERLAAKGLIDNLD